MCPPYSQVVWGFKFLLFLHQTFFSIVGLFLVVLEKVMAAYSSVAWRIPWREEPGGLPSVRSQSQTRLS